MDVHSQAKTIPDSRESLEDLEKGVVSKVIDFDSYICNIILSPLT